MILCDSELQAALDHKQLIIEPRPGPDAIGTSAIDLALGSEFKRWKSPKKGTEVTIDPSASGFNFSDIGNDFLEEFPCDRNGSIVLPPDGFVLGLTDERIELPRSSRLAARVEGRSTLARLGLTIHLTAPTIHAGFRGKITLEIKNLGVLPIRLCPHLKICQLIVEQVFGTPKSEFRSLFQDQKNVTGNSP